MKATLDIAKPTLILNKEKALKNIQRMVEKTHATGTRFRPHFKTHQSAQVGEWFRPFGITSITVSSTEMACYFADHGWHDITLAFPVNWRQVDTLNQLAGRIRLGLLVESDETVQFLQDHLTNPVGIWIKVDVGAHRTGIPCDQPEKVLAIASHVDRERLFTLHGLLTHAGQTYHAKTRAEILQIYTSSRQRLTGLREYLSDSGLPQVKISYGDTPSCTLTDSFEGFDEVRPGNFIFHDCMQLALGVCSEDEIATVVACPVVAKHPERSEIVIYGGAVHLSKEFILDEDGSAVYGYAAPWLGNDWGKPFPHASIRSLSQEHGIVAVDADTFARVQVGDLLAIYPIHSCLVVDLLQQYRTLDGETIQAIGRK